MEVWDAYNKEFEKIEGMTLIRGEAIPDGIYHLVCDVIVKHTDGDYIMSSVYIFCSMQLKQGCLKRVKSSRSTRDTILTRLNGCLLTD